MTTALVAWHPAVRRSRVDRVAFRVGIALIGWSSRARTAPREALMQRHALARFRAETAQQREAIRARGAVGLLP
jgi:hypothetical protein